MKKALKILLVLVLISSISAGGYFSYDYYKNKKNQENSKNSGKFNENLAVEVQKQDMISSLNFVGDTKIKSQQKLKFNSQNKVVGVYKKAGENVKKGELIAEIDKKEVNSQIEISKINLENAKLKLKKLRDENTEIDIKKAENELENLKSDLENKKENLVYIKKEQENKIRDLEDDLTKKNLEYKLLQKEVGNNINELDLSPTEKLKDIEDSKNKLKILQDEYKRDKENFENNLAKKQNEYYSEIQKEYFEIKSTIGSLDKSFIEFDKLLKFKQDKNYGFDYNYYYSVKNSEYKNKSFNYFGAAYSSFLDLEKKFNETKDIYDINNLTDLINLELKVYENLSPASDYTVKGLDNSLESGELTDSIISSYTSQASSLFSEANSKIVSLKNIPINLKTLKKPEEIKLDMENELSSKEKEIEKLKVSISKQQEEYDYSTSILGDKKTQENDKLKSKKQEIEDLNLTLDKTKFNNAYELKSKNKEIETAKISISEAEKKVKDLIDKGNNEEISLAENDVKQAEVGLKKEVEKLDSYEIKAPFDGIITKNDYQVGDNLVENDEKNVIIENPDLLEISIFADQVDITKLAKKQKAIITYDAFPGEEFSGEIIDIDSTPQDKDGVTKYEVKVFMVKKEKEIFSGMKAYVNIVTQEKLGVLAVPFSAVKTDEKTGKEFVTVLEKNGKKVKKFVETGYSDGTNTEIIKGLKEGEKVLEIDYDSNYYKPEQFENQNGGGMY